MKAPRLFAMASIILSFNALFFVLIEQFFFASSAIVCALIVEIISRLEA